MPLLSRQRVRYGPAVDRAASAFLEDLEERGLLDTTIVIWMGDFGRTPRVNRNVRGGGITQGLGGAASQVSMIGRALTRCSTSSVSQRPSSDWWCCRWASGSLRTPPGSR